MPPKRPCTWNGIDYESVAAAAKAVGISDKLMLNFLDAGYSGDDDLVGTGTYNRVTCVWNGVEYPSIAAAARANNTTYVTFYRWITSGYTCDSDVPPVTLRHRNYEKARKPCTWNGVEYKSITAAAKANGITNQAMRMRIQAGYTCDDDMIGEGGETTPCTWNGVEYKSISDAARALGITVRAMSYRIQKGYSSDDDLKP